MLPALAGSYHLAAVLWYLHCEKQVEVYACTQWQDWSTMCILCIHIDVHVGWLTEFPPLRGTDFPKHITPLRAKNHVFYYGKRFTFLYKTRHIFQLLIFYNLTKRHNRQKTSNVVFKKLSLCHKPILWQETRPDVPEQRENNIKKTF